MIHIQLIQ